MHHGSRNIYFHRTFSISHPLLWYICKESMFTKYIICHVSNLEENSAFCLIVGAGFKMTFFCHIIDHSLYVSRPSSTISVNKITQQKLFWAYFLFWKTKTKKPKTQPNFSYIGAPWRSSTTPRKGRRWLPLPRRRRLRVEGQRISQGCFRVNVEQKLVNICYLHVVFSKAIFSKLTIFFQENLSPHKLISNF